MPTLKKVEVKTVYTERLVEFVLNLTMDMLP